MRLLWEALQLDFGVGLGTLESLEQTIVYSSCLFWAAGVSSALVSCDASAPSRSRFYRRACCAMVEPLREPFRWHGGVRRDPLGWSSPRLGRVGSKRQGHRLWASAAQWARQGHPPFGAKPGRGGAPNPGAYEGRIALLHRRVAGLRHLAARAASRWSFARFNHRNQDLKPLLLKLMKSISIQELNQILVRKA